MLSVECTTCNRNVPLYKLEKHHEDHINNKEKEDREFTEMVNNMPKHSTIVLYFSILWPWVISNKLLFIHF